MFRSSHLPLAFNHSELVCACVQTTPDILDIEDYKAFETRQDAERGAIGTFLGEGQIDPLPREESDEIFIHQLLSKLRFINTNQFKKELMGRSKSGCQYGRFVKDKKTEAQQSNISFDAVQARMNLQIECFMRTEMDFYDLFLLFDSVSQFLSVLHLLSFSL
jgi:hypothetical protein